MNRRTRRSLGVAAVAAVAVGLVVDFAAAARQHIEERRPSAAQCEPWCPCKCHQTGCGCHEGKPPGPKLRLVVP